MGLVASVRQFDLIGAARQRTSAETRYLARGLTVGEPPRPEEEFEDLLPTLRKTRDLADAALASLQAGDDEAGLAKLRDAWNATEPTDIHGLVRSVGDRRRALNRLERALPALWGQVDRLQKILAWLDDLPYPDLAQALRGEASTMTAPIRKGNWYSNALQSRAFDAWTRIWDATDGFTASHEQIATVLAAIGDEPGLSRMMLQITLPIATQAVGSLTRLEDHRLALRDLVAAMIVHAETGLWPEGTEPAVRVVRGEVTVTLPLNEV